MTSKPLRLTILLSLFVAPLSGCNVGTATVTGGASNEGSPVGDAGTPNSATNDPWHRTVFEAEVEPVLLDECGSCHTGSGSYPPKFLQADDVLMRVVSHPGLVAPGMPEASELLTKGDHNGPAFSADAASTVTAWVEGLAP